MVERNSQKVREVFSSIAPTYDLLNRLLSLSIDRCWRIKTRKCLEPYVTAKSKVLDLCSGTADLAIELSLISPIVACDFSHPMLAEGLRKSRSRNLKYPIQFVEGDALRLPFFDDTFQVITIAFGLRNLEDYTTGLREIARVLKPGGRLFVLEFSEPEIPLLGILYRFYFQKILPKIGGWISGNHEAYSYLPASVCGYPNSKDLVKILVDAGFCSISRIELTGGISDIHCAVKSP